MFKVIMRPLFPKIKKVKKWKTISASKLAKKIQKNRNSIGNAIRREAQKGNKEAQEWANTRFKRNVFSEIQQIEKWENLTSAEIAKKIDGNLKVVSRVISREAKKGNKKAKQAIYGKRPGGKVIKIKNKKIWITPMEREIMPKIKQIYKIENYGSRLLSQMLGVSQRTMHDFMSKLAKAGDEQAIKWEKTSRTSRIYSVSILKTKEPMIMSPEGLKVIEFIKKNKHRIKNLSSRQIANKIKIMKNGKKVSLSQGAVTSALNKMAKSGHDVAMEWKNAAPKRIEKSWDIIKKKQLKELEIKKKIKNSFRRADTQKEKLFLKFEKLTFLKKLKKQAKFNRKIDDLKRELNKIKNINKYKTRMGELEQINNTIINFENKLRKKNQK